MGALACLDVMSIARGYKSLDAIAKRAAVKIEIAKPVSSGRFVILMSGSISELEESYSAALETVHNQVIDHVLLTNPHAHITFPLRSKVLKPAQSILISEFDTVSSTIAAMDAALKNCDVSLGSVRLAEGIAGKGVASIFGELCEVEEANRVIARVVKGERIIELEIIAQPHAEIIGFF